MSTALAPPAPLIPLWPRGRRDWRCISTPRHRTPQPRPDDDDAQHGDQDQAAEGGEEPFELPRRLWDVSPVAGSRLLVQRPVRDAFLERLAERAAAIRIGDPLQPQTQMGPLCTARQRDYIEAAIARTIAAGGEVIAGGKRPDRLNRGFYFEPTIIATEADGLETFERELFGPVLSVRTFDDEDEAIDLANSSTYHYASGAFTRDIGRAMRVSKRIKAGVTYMNTWRVVSPTAPFGGNGETGYGRESGMDVIHDYTRTKTVWLNTSDAPMPDPFVMR